jgi:hypothetical protein
MKRDFTKFMIALALAVVATVSLGSFDWKEAPPTNTGTVKTFHVVPADATYYSDMVRRFDGNTVFKFSIANWNTVMGNCNSGDKILLYPGTYTPGSTLNVTKGVTIEGATGNRNDVIIDADTSDVVAFTLSAAADYAQIKNLTIDKADSTVELTSINGITIAALCPGVIVDNVSIASDIAGAGPVVDYGIYSESADTTVRNCAFLGCRTPIGVVGSAAHRAVIDHNYFLSTVSTTVAVTLTTGDYHRVTNNLFDLEAAASDAVALTNVAQGFIADNYMNVAMTGSNFASSGSNTINFVKNMESDGTGSVWVTQ